jgi:hypothetical protein
MKHSRTRSLKLLHVTLILTLFSLIFACNKKESFDVSPKVNLLLTQEDLDRTALGKLIDKALNDADVRQLLKTEALRQVNNDYDVLLYQIKDKEIRAGITFGQYLESLGGANNSFKVLLEKLPLTTVFIPNLPAFSANNWDTKSQVPFVGVLNKKNLNNMITVFRDTLSGEVSLNEDPPVDVIVIKDNERITTSRGGTASKLKKDNFIFSDNGLNFYFLNKGVGQVCKSIKNSQILFCTTVRCRGKDAFLMPFYRSKPKLLQFQTFRQRLSRVYPNKINSHYKLVLHPLIMSSIT